MNKQLETFTDLFENKEIRSVWDNKKEYNYFSVVDDIEKKLGSSVICSENSLSYKYINTELIK